MTESNLLIFQAADGKTYQVEYFNLDAIISVGYRVNSTRATAFRPELARTKKTDDPFN